MKIIQSYNCKIINTNKVFDGTISIFRKALSFVVPIVNKNWYIIKDLQLKSKNNFVEKLIHKTKDNPKPKYNFDDLFYKFPSYLRRDVISQAIGIVSSYQSNLSNYNKERYTKISNGKKFKKKEPKLQIKHYKNPVLFKGNMFKRSSLNEIQIKIYKNNDWVWLNAKLRQQDINYILKKCNSFKESSPSLIKKGRKYFLQFSYESIAKLSNAPVSKQIVLGVDLGLNHSAVCSVINSQGTVVGRKFINQPIEKDRMNKLLNRSKKKYYQTGSKQNMPKIWGKINSYNKQIINNTVCEIIKFAKQYNVTTIVMEYLSFKGKKKNKKMQLQMWAKRTINHKVQEKAHSVGIKFCQVCAKNTSQLAFDGSGSVKRNKLKYNLCTFSSGKTYNCDLNASYNIAARGLIKIYNKAIPAKEWSLIEAKVPLLMRRTQCTLSTLISLAKVI